MALVVTLFQLDFNILEYNKMFMKYMRQARMDGMRLVSMDERPSTTTIGENRFPCIETVMVFEKKEG